MKKLEWTMIGAALGVIFTATFISQASAQGGTLTLYGDAPKGTASGSVWNFAFEDPKTGRIVARQEGKVTVKDGRYFAEIDRGDLDPSTLYSVRVNGANGEELAPATYVTLQGTTPGSAETGNINVTGNVIAGKISTGNGGSWPYLVNGHTTTTTGGVFGASAGNGVRGVTTDTGTGFAGGSFKANNGASYGIFSVNSATDGQANAGYFQSSSNMGSAIRAVNNSTSPFGQRFGVVGEANGPDIMSDFSAGVKGVMNSSGIGGALILGVHGVSQGTGLLQGYALFASGTTGATGTKSFVIDHPMDPENKLLKHYCAEGAEPLLIYSGTTVLDGSGGATVALPGYWASVNKDPRYQLTPVGAAMPNLHIGSEVKNKQFRISGGAPNAKVTWTITGTRNDPFVRAAGIQNEMVKSPTMKGKYFHPSLYGQPDNKAYTPATPAQKQIDPQ